MRVVHLYDGHEQVYDGRGSVPNVVWHLARETAAAGHDVTVLERRWAGLPAAAEREGVSFRRLDLATGADEPWTRVPYEMVTSPVGLARLVGDRTNFALEALRWLRSREFDALHVHLPFAASVLVTVAPWLRDRTVYTAHLGELRLDALGEDATESEDGETDDAEDDGGIEVPAVVQHLSPDVYLATRAAKTAVLNPEIRDVFEDRGVPGSKLAVVPNGVDLSRFGDPDAAAVERVADEYGLGGGPVVLFVGTVMPRKGVVELVEAVERVVARGHDPRLVVAGETDLDPEYTERVRSRIRNAGLDDRVELAGFVPDEDLPALYALADLFVAPSLEEGFGMTVAEAMAAGTPVVGTDAGRVPWLLDGGRCGRVVDPGDPAALADAVAWLLDDPAERERLGERATERVEAVSWEGVTQELLSVYEEVRQ